MSKENALSSFVETVRTYDVFLPKLKRLVEELGLADKPHPNGEGETYVELYQRESAHFEALYGAEQYEALQSHPMTDEELSAASTAFFIDLEEILEYDAHVDFLLAELS